MEKALRDKMVDQIKEKKTITIIGTQSLRHIILSVGYATLLVFRTIAISSQVVDVPW